MKLYRNSGDADVSPSQANRPGRPRAVPPINTHHPLTLAAIAVVATACAQPDALGSVAARLTLRPGTRAAVEANALLAWHAAASDADIDVACRADDLADEWGRGGWECAAEIIGALARAVGDATVFFFFFSIFFSIFWKLISILFFFIFYY
jgi:hypothetical protein